MWISQGYRYVNIIGATADNARDIMIEGESGIMSLKYTKTLYPHYRPSKRCIEWSNGARTLIFTADNPEILRGKQHEKLWADELASWRYTESWDQAMFGLRLGDNPQAIISTTPRPIKIIKELANDPSTHLTVGTTYDNRQNLAPAFFEQIIKKYEGTRLGRQELNAEILEDNPHAIFKREWIDANRVNKSPDLDRVVISVDPSVSSNIHSNECGITVCGKLHDHYYILNDSSMVASGDEWASRAVNLFYHFQADLIVGEKNQGGDLVEKMIKLQDPNVPYKGVHATRGKDKRAEPIGLLYEQNRVHHIGAFPRLEDQMCAFDPTLPPHQQDSPDRMDSLVWGLHELAYGTRNEFSMV